MRKTQQRQRKAAAAQGRNARTSIQTGTALAALAVTAAVGSAARADVVFGDFENDSTAGWGWLTGDNRGIVPWDSTLGPANGTVTTAASGPLAGSKVLRMTGDASWNYGQSAGAVLAFDMVPQNFRAAFLAHDQIEFDWYAPPDPNSTSGWSQIYNDVMNSEANGWQTVGGFGGGGDANQNQYYFTGFNGSLKHVVIDYTAYKNAVLASANPDGGGWIQLGFQLNAGGGAPAEMWFDNFKFSVAPNNWTLNDNGTWSTDSNWSKGTHPNAAGAVANFGPAISEARTVTVDAAKTVGQINFNNASKYTIAGTETLTLDSSSAVGITVSNGSHDITAPLALAKDVNIAVSAADGTLTLSNLQASPVAVTKTGAGALSVNNIRANSLSVNAGKVKVLQNAGAAGASKVGTLSIGAGATLDLTNNKLVTDTALGTFSGGAYSGIQGDIARAYNFGAWDQPGLTTSEELANPLSGPLGGTTTIAVNKASEVLFIGDTDTAVFAGQTVTGASTIAMYTYAGDVNLDGLVDAADYGVIDNWIQFPGTDGYMNGDFNYDGVIDAADYGIIDNSIQLQGDPIPVNGAAAAAAAAAATAGVTAVPEPGAATLLLAGAAGLLRRRRRTS